MHFSVRQEGGSNDFSPDKEPATPVGSPGIIKTSIHKHVKIFFS